MLLPPSSSGQVNQTAGRGFPNWSWATTAMFTGPIDPSAAIWQGESTVCPHSVPPTSSLTELFAESASPGWKTMTISACSDPAVTVSVLVSALVVFTTASNVPSARVIPTAGVIVLPVPLAVTTTARPTTG